ncbi:MAG: hypothetical protein NTZ48_05685 [Candidatus Omnitrophica bacterium]|nr:hypothetical protein [Candidatus Omnitrophota bacterium]
MIVYKLVTKEGRSIGVIGSPSAIQYKVGETIVAPKFWAKYGYHLFVFKTINDAFLHSKCACLLECVIDQADIITDIPPSLTWEELMATRPLSVTECKYSPPYVYSWPRGTMMVKKLKVLRQIAGDPIP